MNVIGLSSFQLRKLRTVEAPIKMNTTKKTSSDPPRPANVPAALHVRIFFINTTSVARFNPNSIGKKKEFLCSAGLGAFSARAFDYGYESFDDIINEQLVHLSFPFANSVTLNVKLTGAR